MSQSAIQAISRDQGICMMDADTGAKSRVWMETNQGHAKEHDDEKGL
ncbi:MAG: hypothetical protein SWQ30_21745 [Thermodesulfobacteriota bacterium]|nr:hypothetical protein [Thermodesulfobacteriota bacterium]